MLNPITFLKKPEYFFHPSQALRRFRRIWHSPQEVETTRLPWGTPVTVRIAENVGSDIFWYGVFDRIVPEAIWRLLDKGETGVDIGANIGQNSSVMALRSGLSGWVIAFEPHPVTFAELQQNVANWANLRMARIQLENVALGRENGEAQLVIRGYLSGASLAAQGEGVKVPVRQLDDFLKGMPVSVCKIDVEGHELAVLEGAAQALSRQAIRDVIFEDFNPMPSPVARLLQKNGFSVYQLTSGWLKPSLAPVREGINHPKDFSYNYLATLAPQRARDRFRAPGWRCLMGC
jgi:FkbM family methyltransferase